MTEADNIRYEKNKMQKDMILSKLREVGCRITKQRLILLDIILSKDCSCCKEIFYEASKFDKGIGQSTVYRMVGLLEEIGAINRKNMYKISCDVDSERKDTCQIELNDNTICQLSAKQWNDVIIAGLLQYGYIKQQEIRAVSVLPCEC